MLRNNKPIPPSTATQTTNKQPQIGSKKPPTTIIGGGFKPSGTLKAPSASSFSSLLGSIPSKPITKPISTTTVPMPKTQSTSTPIPTSTFSQIQTKTEQERLAQLVSRKAAEMKRQSAMIAKLSNQATGASATSHHLNHQRLLYKGQFAHAFAFAFKKQKSIEKQNPNPNNATDVNPKASLIQIKLADILCSSNKNRDLNSNSNYKEENNQNKIKQNALDNFKPDTYL